MIDWTTRRTERWSPARAWCWIVGHDWVLMYYELVDADIQTCWRCGQRNPFTREEKAARRTG